MAILMMHYNSQMRHLGYIVIDASLFSYCLASQPQTTARWQIHGQTAWINFFLLPAHR